MGDDIDRITRELAEVQDALLALPDGAFAERYELQKRQDALREQAAGFSQDWDATRATEDLLAELGALRTRLAALEGERIDMVTQSGSTAGAGPGADAGGGVVLNQQIAAAQGAGNVHARIGRIKGILTDRGVDPDETAG